MLEIVVKRQIEKSVETNKIVTENINWVLINNICIVIQTASDDWNLIISGRKMVRVIFIDLKRAFQTIGVETD